MHELQCKDPQLMHRRGAERISIVYIYEAGDLFTPAWMHRSLTRLEHNGRLDSPITVLTNKSTSVHLDVWYEVAQIVTVLARSNSCHARKYALQVAWPLLKLRELAV